MWARQIAAGLEFMHEMGLIHRDIKAKNILLDVYNNALVADLGLVQQATASQRKSSLAAKTPTAKKKSGLLDHTLLGAGLRKGKAFLRQTTSVDFMCAGTPTHMAPEVARLWCDESHCGEVFVFCCAKIILTSQLYQ